MNKVLENFLFISGFMANEDDHEFLLEKDQDFFKKVFHFRVTQGNPLEAQEQLVELLNKINPQGVLAYSMGGRLLLSILCHHHPALTWRPQNIFLESVGLGGLSSQQCQERFLLDQKRAKEIREDFSQFLKAWYDLPLWQFDIGEKAKMIEKKLGLDLSPSELAQIIEAFSPGAFFPDDSLSYVIEHDFITYIAGERDLKYKEWASALGERGIVVENCGHNIHFQKPNKIREIIKNRVG